MYEMGKSPGRANWLTPGTTVNLSFIFPNKQNDEQVKAVLTALWWLENFGGIGARSRRGAGSFQVTKISTVGSIKGTPIPQFMYQNWNPGKNSGERKNKIYRFLEQGIKISCPYVEDDQSIPAYSAYRNSVSNYKIATGFSNWTEAAHYIGTKLADFRKNAPFHNEAADLYRFAVSGTYPEEGPNPLTKSAFGLPITYRFRNRDPNNRNPRTGKMKYMIDESVISSGTKKSRRGSPLFIKIGKYPGENRYYVAALSLWSEFFPAGEKIQLKVRGGRHGSSIELKQPPKNAIDNFLNTI